MDQRRSRRARTLLQGRVVFNNRFSLIECVVRDISDTGAQISFSHPVELPPELELEIPKKGLSTQAKVMWSDGKNHGLMFIGGALEATHDSSPALPESDTPGRSSPQEASISTPPDRIQDVLEEARRRIAQLAGVPADTVRLKLEIDY